MGEYIKKGEAVELARCIAVAISNLPPSDVVEVVRCNYCSYYRENYTENGDNWSIHYQQYCKNWEGETLPNGFCMKGERR